MNLSDLIKEFGFPPPILEDEPMEGFNFVVRVDPYVNIHTMLIGVLDDEEANIRLVGEAE